MEDLECVLAALARYCAPVRRRLGVRRLALGLWLSRRSASELLASPDARARLREALETNGLELVTLNGFPYGDFHAERVKEEVYRPDWADVRRHRYTLDLANLLCELLPADVAEGTISTLPLTYAPTARPSSAEDSATILAHLAVDLDRLAERSGRQIRVCLEPEPDCIVETSDQAIACSHEQLRPAVRRRGVDPAIVDRHLGLCFDACHQAVEFEDPAAAWTKIAAAGIRVGKVQLSCALEVPAEASSRAEGRLRPFDEIRFLHQVRRRDRTGVIEGWTDLGPALAAREGFAAELGPVLPAVTCSAQATMVTGKLPRDHGIVGNGWYFRELNEVWLWRQSGALIEGEKIWDAARRRDPSFRCANLFWWYNMNTTADLGVTPRPTYPADGPKLFGI